MKKLIGILGVAFIAMTLFFNTNTMNSSNNIDLSSLIATNVANAEGIGGAIWRVWWYSETHWECTPNASATCPMP